MTQEISRRGFLAGTTALVPLLPAVSLLESATAAPASHQAKAAEKRAFFSTTEAAFIDAAMTRLIPKDDLGPGALEANVTGFIDLQLAGPYGRADRWYMEGPWPTGTDQQGYQLKLNPAELYRAAIAAIDAYCQQKHGKPFSQLGADRQDDLLHGLEAGKIDLGDVPADTFFSLLWQNTQEGFLADPVYSGNRDFAGWKLIGFPGPRYNYVNDIEKHGQPYKAPFVSLGGRNPKPHDPNRKDG